MSSASGNLRIFLELFCWLLPPSRTKNFLLNRFGHDIASTATVLPSVVVGVRRVVMGQYAHIGLLNVIRNLSYLGLEDYARMDQWNWISAHPVYQSVDAEAGTLFMATSSRLGSRCYLDCSGTISIRHYGFVGGHGCMLHTHTADYSCDMQTIGRITVGHHSMVCSRAVVLCGSFIPERSLVAANSTFTPRSSRDRKPGLYAGNPAVWKRDTPGSGWFVRRTYSTHGHGIKGPMGILPDDRTPPEFCGPPTDVGVNNGKLVVLEDLT